MTRIRRRLDEAAELVTEVDTGDGRWVAAGDPLGYASPFRPEWEAARAKGQGAKAGDLVLPFQPLSVRDFTISERHNIDAARGYLRRFMPAVSTMLRAAELVTRRPPKPLRPSKLWYQQPIYYLNNPVTFVPSGTPVAVPSYTAALDYEMQLAFIIDRPLYDADPAEAEQAISAFVLMCDFTARDVQIDEMRSGTGPQKAKHFLSSMATVVVSSDEIQPIWRNMTGIVTINGESVAQPTTADSRYGLGELLAHASTSEQLIPGEMFSIGCLAGGSGMETGNWLGSGDEVVLDLPAVGSITHRIL